MTTKRTGIIAGCSLVCALFAVFFFTHSGGAATNIRSAVTDHWAWNDAIGWMDFYNTNTVTVSGTEVTGYASSSVGDISLDCATTRIGSICLTSDYRVTNDGAGNLSGWGWNDVIGWISFDCNNTGGCGTSNYRVYIDAVTGDFNNYAWNDAIGWISFNCVDGSFCGTSNYKVSTTWQATSTSGVLESVTFDTLSYSSSGAKVNSVLWRGSQPAGTSVRFQFAAGSSWNGPWNYQGPDGTANTYYTVGPDVVAPLAYAFHNGTHFRYRIQLTSNPAQTETPRVDQIIVNWSP